MSLRVPCCGHCYLPTELTHPCTATITGDRPARTLCGGDNTVRNTFEKGASHDLRQAWHALQAQINKLANVFWTADPIAQMQYEYDKAIEQMKEGRLGLEQYRALVERV